MFRALATRYHGMMDYLMAVFLIVFLFIFYSHFRGTALWVSVAVGAFMIVYSLVTNYEAGATGWISMRTHLGLDILVGFMLALSPWLFGVMSYGRWPRVYFILFGVAEIGIALITRPVPAGGPGSLFRGHRTGGHTLGHP